MSVYIAFHIDVLFFFVADKKSAARGKKFLLSRSAAAGAGSKSEHKAATGTHTQLCSLASHTPPEGGRRVERPHTVCVRTCTCTCIIIAHV